MRRTPEPQLKLRGTAEDGEKGRLSDRKVAQSQEVLEQRPNMLRRGCAGGDWEQDENLVSCKPTAEVEEELLEESERGRERGIVHCTLLY